MNTLEECMNLLSNAMQKFTVCIWINDVLGLGRLKLPFLQLANDLRDSAFIRDLHARLRKIDDMHHKVEDIHTYERPGMQPVSGTLSRQEMPLKPEVFYGRDDLVEGIAQLLLQEETSRVCILGPGGMGKTSVSLAVVELPLIKERFPGGNIVWLPCIEATSATLLLEILYIQLQIPGDKEVTLEKIISELETLKQPRLIVVDNFETPWNGNQKQVGDILRRMAMLSHIAILVTMRGRHPPCDKAIKWQSKDIKSTDEAACLRIYHDINPDSKDDSDVARLLTALGRMPFAVTLMAKLGLESQSSAKDLLDAWSESGPDILSNDPEQSMNRSIRLSVESDLVKRNPNAIHLLAILSLLPAGTTKENLHWWAPELKMSMIITAIATLSQAALLVENRRENSASPVLFVVPVVQSFMQHQNRIAQEVQKQVHILCCEYVLAHASRYDDSDPIFNEKSKALAAEDTNIQSIIFSSPSSQLTVPSHGTVEALIAFNRYRCNTKPNLEIADHVVMAAKASKVQRYIATAVQYLGLTYFRLGNYNTSYNHLQEAYQLFNTLPAGDVESQRLGVLCGIDLVENARFVLQVDEVVSLAWDVEKKCTALSDDLVHGRSLLKLGTALYDAKQWQEALCYMDQARTVFKVVENTFNLASTYQVISWVYLGEHRLPDALHAIEEAWKYAELTANRLTQVSISLDFGRILFNTNQDTSKAWKHIELSLINASYFGDRQQVARALDYVGYGYLRRGDYQNAYGAYEAAAEKYLGTVDARFSARCKDNMASIKRKQGNPDAVVGFYRPALDIDRTLFYPPVQEFASGPL
jgi:tetratricopeptide (TPR) repeat protein